MFALHPDLVLVEDMQVRRHHLIASSAVAVAAAATVVAAVSQAGGVHPRAGVAEAAVVSGAKVAHPRTASTIDPALTAAVQDRLSRSTAQVYSVVVDVADVGRVVDLNGSSRLLPASSEKLFTTLPWLLSHAQDQLVTTVSAAAPPVAGILNGDLVVQAAADPTVMGASLVSLAQQVHQAGVTKVTGRLVLDIGQLSATRTRQGWKSSYVPDDIGPLSPFPVHEDVWRTSSSYVRDPTGANLALFRSKLKDAGVTVAGGNVVARSGSTTTVLATYKSPAVAAIIGHALRYSDNFQAEQLLAVEGWAPVSAQARAAGAGGTTTDGSGLSLRDRRSASDEVALLEYAHQSSAAALLQQSLPIACKTGTLRHEMCNTVAAGVVWAKTGTLDHVKALAGYTSDAQGRWVTFAFLTNGDSSTSKAMNAIERAVLVLRHYGQQSS